jgi:glycosyltransferase involved in cell wall biosynthesis
MKSIGLITDVPFWKIGLGKHARIQELCRFLALQSRLTLYYIGEEVAPFPGPIVLQGEDKPGQLQAHLAKAGHDLLIVSYLHLHWVADLGHVPIYLDAIDLLSERGRSFASYNRKIDSLSFQEEIALFHKFDKVIFMQKEEIEKVVPHLGADRVLLCPHPVVPEDNPLFREQVQKIGFLGSPSWPNIDGVQWFHDAVLPLLGDLAEKCVVNGTMSSSPLSAFSPRLAKGSVVDSPGDHYKNVDIAINPCLYGSGLKIKTVEAIAYGIPLVTTSVGAQGLREEAGNSFLLADTPEAFADALHALAESAELRRQLSLGARAFARQHLTPAACFGALLT